MAGKKNKKSGEVVDDAIDGVTDESKVVSSEQPESIDPIVDEESDLSLQLAKLEADLLEAKDESLRNQAEMQNILRRSERDVQNAHKYALDKFVAELLPVVDNLERALQSIDQNKEDLKSLAEGVVLTLKSFQDVLARYKVLPIDPKGEVFDPELHQAMSILEMPGSIPNTVVDVFQKGYTLNDRLVRPAMVVVAGAEKNNI
ncbi:nucleotide exchange factor GrpE [Porticoccus sp. Uisw_050_02]|uniref:nucleotide exchange factor GrpE n=1 Tax=Porticoccus sp. Uisw_050_02 TaxID=3230978 RepID=UPI0039EC49A6